MSYSKRKETESKIAVAEPLVGMLVAGYMVLVFTSDMKKPPVMYGMFDDLDKALDWAELLTGIVTVHPVYEPAMKYKHINTDVYNVLENKIYDLGYDVELQVAPYSPWPIVYIDCDDNSDIEFIIESLEKMGYDVDDIVFSDDY